MHRIFLQTSLIDWKTFWLGSENWAFLLETLLRTVVMFLVIVVGLRLLGKRGVKQLSVFELVVIIGLGSAAGDPMFYADVGLLPALVVFISVISLYRLVTYFVGKYKRFESLMEGEPVCLISGGRFAIGNFEKETLAYDEFFAELRQQGIMHLGQVHTGFIETSGSISVFFYADENVKWGLPILPELFKQRLNKITVPAHYACAFCGYTEALEPASKHICPICKRELWVVAINNKRIT